MTRDPRIPRDPPIPTYTKNLRPAPRCEISSLASPWIFSSLSFLLQDPNTIFLQISFLAQEKSMMKALPEDSTIIGWFNDLHRISLEVWRGSHDCFKHTFSDCFDHRWANGIAQLMISSVLTFVNGQILTSPMTMVIGGIQCKWGDDGCNFNFISFASYVWLRFDVLRISMYFPREL